MRVTLLGTGCPGPLIERFGPCTMVEAGGDRLLFDCGRGVIQRSYQLDPARSRIEASDKLFLTHLHSDHTVGIPDLWLTGWLFGRFDNPLRVWGPRGTEKMMSHLEEAFTVDKKVRWEMREHFKAKLNEAGVRVEATDVDEGYVYMENGVKVTPFRVNHFYYSDEPSLGYRIDYRGRSTVISGDTCICENLIEFSKDVDLLIHEVCAAPLGHELDDRTSRPYTHHTPPEEAGEVFTRVTPKLAVFTHVIQWHGVGLEEMLNRTQKVYNGPVIMGEDLMTFEVGDSVELVS